MITVTCGTRCPSEGVNQPCWTSTWVRTRDTTSQYKKRKDLGILQRDKSWLVVFSKVSRDTPLNLS